VAALEDPKLPEASIEWIDLDHAAIRAQVSPGRVLSVQVSYDPGWRATVNGNDQPIERDGLGMLVIRPKCERGCTVQLSYVGGAEQQVAGFSALVLLAGVVVIGGLKAVSSAMVGGRSAGDGSDDGGASGDSEDYDLQSEVDETEGEWDVDQPYQDDDGKSPDLRRDA